MSEKHYEALHRYDFLTKELLIEEYSNNKLTDQQIADKYHMPSKTVIWNKRKKFGIANRFNAKSNRHAKTNRKFNITKEKAISLLDEGQTYEEISEYMGCSIMVARRRFKELGLVEKQNHGEKYAFLNVSLTGFQHQMVLGSALGDGTIAKHGAYSCSHSHKQEQYLDHKMSVLSTIHHGAKQHAIHKQCGIDGEHHESYHFTTGCNSELIDLRKIFYPKGKKIFPHDYLITCMKAEALAYWYMDDGAKVASMSKICTYGYTYDENVLMQKLLFQLFGLHSKVQSVDDGGKFKGYCQSLSTGNTLKFFDLIRPYIVPSMMYKIGV